MEFSIEYRDGHMAVKASGDADFESFARMHYAILNHDNWKPGTPVLIDHSDANVGSLTVSNVRDVAADVVKYADKIGRSRCAFLVSRDLEYGMIRMWMVFVEDKWLATAKIFRSREEAIAWLSV